MTVITEKTAKKMKRPIQKSEKILCGPDGNRLDIIGEMDIELVSSTGLETTGRVCILKGAKTNLLGKPEILQFGLVKGINRVEDNIYNKHPKLFRELGELPDVFKIHLKEESSPICINVPRRLPIGLREATKKELDRMEKLGVIEKVEKPTEWCSGMVVAPKANGKVRICVDLTQLNKSVKREYFPLPRLEESLASIKGSRYFSKMDANSGFWQIKLEEESREYTTFITPFGRYMFKKMPFGISAAPEFFQRQMTKVLTGLEGVVCMMDDVLVVGNTKHEHDERLRKVLSKIEENGLTLNKDKCEFGVERVKFLGHIIDKEGIHVDPEKEKAIKGMKEPGNRKELRRFLAMVNYLSRFSPQLSEVQIPLRELDKNKVPWLWTSKQQESFEKVKEIVSSSPVLTLFDNNAKHRITADASKNTLGAALLQRNDQGKWQPVNYASRKLTEVERRYGQIEKEALAITWACEKFDYYLVGREFSIETDHKPLIPLLGDKDLSDLPLRIQRFKMRMMRYSYEIFHTPGDKMYLADLLSRPPSPKELVKIGRVERHAKQMIGALEDRILERIREEGEKDKEYRLIKKNIEEGWKDRVSGEVKKLKGMTETLSVIEGLVMMKSRLLIPKNLRAEMLEKLHEGHQGKVKTYRRSQEAIWWPSIRREINEMIESCTQCIKEREIQHQPMTTTQLPEGPWKEIGTDLFEFEGKQYAIFIDYYSRWIEVTSLANSTGKEIVKKFRPLIARYGIPKQIRSDNGPCYVSEEWKEMMEEYMIHHVTSSPHYPESNGLAERGVKIVKNMWRKEKNKNRALMAYRTTALESGSRPDELFLNRRMRNSIPIQDTKPINTENFRERDNQLKERQKKNFDQRRRAKPMLGLEKGDTVWVKINNRDRGRKGVIYEKSNEPDSFWVDIGNSRVRRNRKHLRKINNRDSEVDQNIVFNSNSKIELRSRNSRTIKPKTNRDYVYY